MSNIISNNYRRHKGELQSLKDADPEFFQFLAENDQNLLDFGENEDDDDSDDGFSDEEDNLLADEDDEDDEILALGGSSDTRSRSTTSGGTQRKRGVKIDVTIELLKSVVKKSVGKSKSISALKKMMMIFRAACVPDIERDFRLDNDSDNSDSDEELGHTSSKKAKPSTSKMNNNKFVIREPEIYEKVMVIVIEAAAK